MNTLITNIRIYRNWYRQGSSFSDVCMFVLVVFLGNPVAKLKQGSGKDSKK